MQFIADRGRRGYVGCARGDKGDRMKVDVMKSVGDDGRSVKSKGSRACDLANWKIRRISSFPRPKRFLARATNSIRLPDRLGQYDSDRGLTSWTAALRVVSRISAYFRRWATTDSVTLAVDFLGLIGD